MVQPNTTTAPPFSLDYLAGLSPVASNLLGALGWSFAPATGAGAVNFENYDNNFGAPFWHGKAVSGKQYDFAKVFGSLGISLDSFEWKGLAVPEDNSREFKRAEHEFFLQVDNYIRGVINQDFEPDQRIFANNPVMVERLEMLINNSGLNDVTANNSNNVENNTDESMIPQKIAGIPISYILGGIVLYFVMKK